MGILTESELQFAKSVSRLSSCNPFLPERVECEREALGVDFVDSGPIWHVRTDLEVHPNVERLAVKVESLVEAVGKRLATNALLEDGESRFYRDAVVYLLYNRYEDGLLKLRPGTATRRVAFYHFFRADFERLLRPVSQRPDDLEPAHLFACFFQVRRAFQLIFHNIIGGSMPTARLRAAVWQSIFTRDVARYRRSLYARMTEVTTLVTGPSGTGKELVARAIGLARYIPFDEASQSFAEDHEASFFPLNLSALSPTLIESELFGHRRGSFTGAVDGRVGWLETCSALGTVFLDEIGDVDPAIQVKLLRVLQTRVFQALGDTEDRLFEGKIIAATNRDPAVEMREGRLREDLYYRLCSDLIETPTLASQLADSPADLGNLVLFLASRIVGNEEAAPLRDEVIAWVEKELGPQYTWPGNVRELEQCVRNVMIRGAYHPQRALGRPDEELAAAVTTGGLTAAEMMGRYVTLTYVRAGSYQKAAKQLGLDRRTVKARIDEAFLERLRA